MANFGVVPTLSSLPLGHLEATLKTLEAAGVQEIHVDVSDGLAAPGFGFGAEMVRTVKAASGLRCVVHLMAQETSRAVDHFDQAGCDGLIVQAEVCAHGHRVLGQIREAGMKAGLAVFPGTSLTELEYLLPLADRLLLMGAEPGGKCFIRSALERIRILNENIRYREYRIDLQVEGPMDNEIAAKALHFGAQSLVIDVADFFDGADSPNEKLTAFTQALQAAQKVV
jgi:ribulose-phosphate 3-epimerase